MSTDSSAAPTAAPAPSRRSAPSVLVVDDDPEIRGAIAATLREAGVFAEEALGPRHARRLLERRPFDATVIDLVMPRRNGIELLADLRTRKHGRGLPAVVLSVLPRGAARRSALRQVREMGAAALLDKPVSPRRLMVTLVRLLTVR